MNKQRIAKELVSIAKELASADDCKKAKDINATWSFDVPVEVEKFDVKIDWRKVIRGLKDGNVDVDIASSIKRVVDKNGVVLARGKRVHAEKTFLIELYVKDGELQVLVD